MHKKDMVGWFMVFNATFNNISVISWRSVLCVEETKVPEENLSQVTDKSYHIGCIKYTSPWAEFELTTLVVIGTDCTGSCKFNYHDHDGPQERYV
jgi:ribonuclease HIII